MNDHKKIRNAILIGGLVIVSLMIPCVAAAASPQTGHPYLLFHDINEVTGYQYRTINPWKTYQRDFQVDADAFLSKNITAGKGISYGGISSRLGLMYQITKKPVYSLKAQEALLNINSSDSSIKTDRAGALQSFSLAYDWIQPTLDTNNDTIIRDKLATLADKVYKDLNENGTSLSYIAFSDYHGQAYPNLGVASAALYDYTNPNNLPLSSMPADWHRAGKEYYFENDLLHKYGRSMFSYGFDEASGKNLLGDYKSYPLNDMVTWFQASKNTYNENLLELYPAAKKAVTSETWESLPNQYSSNYDTNGNILWNYNKAILNLLPDNEKGPVLNHIERAEAANILPYSSILGGRYGGTIQTTVLYSVVGKYDSIPRTFPTTTSHLNPDAFYQVFRENWNDDSDWLSLITWNKITKENRDMGHNDQMSFEYYSRGDLLLADAGEPKYLGSYGTHDIHHNTVAIEDPRTPFPVSSWSGSTSQGIFKGNINELATPVTVDTIVQMPWIQMMQTKASITKIIDSVSSPNGRTLSSPIAYERTIMYPESDYFVIIDRMEGTQSWTYRNIFRPTSLIATPTLDVNKNSKYDLAEIGYVNGSLKLGTTPYDWQSLPQKTETTTGITTNSLLWTTRNPYGKDVLLNLYSSPSSEILIEKNTGRIGGLDAKSEVYSPVVYFRTPQDTSEYRVTALLSSYSTEEAKVAQEIDVVGTGHALKVSSSLYDDYIYTGKGTSSFAGFTTDADTIYIRKQGSVNEYTLVQGSFLTEANISRVNITQKVDLLTLKQTGNIIKFNVKGENSADIRMEQTLANSVIRDGSVYSDWVMENNSTTLKISTTLSEHEFEISSENRLVIDPLSSQMVNVNEQLQFPLNISYTGAGELQSSVSNLPDSAVFNATSRIFSWTPATNQTGNYTVTFNVTDGRLSDSRDVLITVNTGNQAPVLEPIGNQTVNAGFTIQFAVNATDPDGDRLTYSAYSLPANAMFDTETRIFSWTPATNQTGSYTVTFNVTDSRLSDSRDVLITVNTGNQAPVLEPIGNQTVNAGFTIQFAVNATDPDGDRLTYSAYSLPANAMFDTETRIFSWTPATNQTGSYTVTFNVTDSRLSDSRDVLITVNTGNQAPVLEPIGNQTVNAGFTIQYAINATDPDGDRLTYSAYSLPANAMFDTETRIFSWTPATNQTGNYTVTFNVTDSRLSDSRDVLITVNTGNQAPVLEPIGNQTVNAGSKLQFVMNATDPDRDTLTYSVSGLPANATFDPASHTFSWIPADGQAGSYNVTFTVRDGALQDSESVRIIVNDGNNAPVFGPVTDASVNQREFLTIGVTASDPDGDVLTYSASNLPVGAMFNPVTRQFSWSPAYNQAGNYTVTFSVSDGILSASQNVTITAIKVNYAPYFTLGNVTTRTYNQGYPIRVNINAADWNRDVITYSATNLPKGATVDSATHKFSWTPGHDQAGTYNITLIISDGNLQNSKLLRIIVKGGNNAPVFGPVTDASVNQKEVLTVRVTASDPDGDVLTYSASNLPVGAMFNPVTRQFSWSPAYNQAGNYTVTFSVSDGILSASKNVTITAIKVNHAPFFTLGNVMTQTYNQGYPINVNIKAADWNRDVITYSATNLPKGATVDSATHTFSWTPGHDQAGTYEITLIISDGNLQDSRLLRIIVNDFQSAQKTIRQTPRTYIKLS